MASNFTIDSKIGELDSFDRRVTSQTPGEEVARLFNQEENLPGVLIVDSPEKINLISRENFYENTGRQFGTEVYYKRPIGMMLDRISHAPMVIASDCKISFATRQVLQRKGRDIFEPIVITYPEENFRIVSSKVLFMAQNQILLTMHNQNLDSKTRGIEISDAEAVQRFMQYARLSNSMELTLQNKKFTIRCEHCGNPIHYTIADVVRSHPQINRCMEIKETLGMQFFTFYLIHKCGSNVYEIPVLHDSQLEYRSMRPARWMDSYA